MPLQQGQIRLPERDLNRQHRRARNYAKRNFPRRPDQTPWSPIVNSPVMDISRDRRERSQHSLRRHGTNLQTALANGTRGTRRVVGSPASRTFHDTEGPNSVIEEFLHGRRGGKSKKNKKTSKRRTYKNKK